MKTFTSPPLMAAVSGYHSPWGLVLLAAGSAGLVALDLTGTNLDDLTVRLGARLGGVASSIHEPAVPSLWRETLDQAIGELDEYFAGRRRSFDLRLAPLAGSGLDQTVLTATAELPFGQTTSYGELARIIGRPKAARAVGGALGRNPLPIFIPCHRVLGASGALGGYGGGWHSEKALRSRPELLAIKRHLLVLEGALPAADAN
jgi:methylated-DNA-[protein]-cysteine S-methyltransferase